MSTKLTLTEQLASKYNLAPDSFTHLLKNQFISVGRNDPPPTNAEMALLMLAINKYDLDPNLKQVHAFRHKGKLNIMVGVDGWIAFANRQQGYEGVTYEYSETMVESPDGKGKKCWEWVKATIHSKDRIATEVICFLDEWYQGQKGNYPGPWQSMTRHRLRQKAFTQAVREHYGFSVYDDTDREKMINSEALDGAGEDETNNSLNDLSSQLNDLKGRNKQVDLDKKDVDLDKKDRPPEPNTLVKNTNNKPIEAEFEEVQEDLFEPPEGEKIDTKP